MIRRVFLLTPVLSLALFADAVTDAAKKKVSEGKYEEAITELDAAVKKNPKSAVYKKALADAYFEHGNAQMNNAQLPPMRKYPAALRAFRKTMELDPKNTQAASNAKMIEDIYKSMGRPVPQ
ncbi:hypothetical protein F183_A51970 [Bryobacterales bacterium F-183]|nr:hypothetical protein F183_A51970 [Bryobacterales bacterium F-183]